MKKMNFHIVKRDQVSWKYSFLVRALAILASLLVSDGYEIHHVFNLHGNCAFRKRPLNSLMLYVSYQII